MAELYELNVTVSGLVQGVCFRYFTQDMAKQLGIVGWVRNTYDGKVEVKSHGEKKLLEQLLNFVKKGPSAAKVTDVRVEWKNISQTEYSGFSIKY